MRTASCGLLLLAACGIAQAQTQPTAAPPAYTPVRWNEDYRYLQEPATGGDFWDSLKYIQLGDDPQTYLSLGGQARYRYEFFDNNTFGAGMQDGDGFHLLRVLLHADLHLGPNLRAFVQGKSALEDGRDGGARPTDEDRLDLQQGFVDLKVPVADTPVLIRAGRQDLLYGAQRLISPLDWANVRRTFDGVKGSFTFKQHTVDLFYVRPVLVDEDQYNDNDTGTDFVGIYDTILLPELIANASSRWELYLLYLDRDSATWPTEGVGSEERFTAGTRFYTNPKPWDFDAELAYQFGDFGGGDISAWSIAFEAGHRFSAALDPRVFIGLDAASGDNDPGDGDVNTFNQLFPLGHAYLGYIDQVGRQNIIDLHPGVEVILVKNKRWAKQFSLRSDYHMFWRQDNSDALYNAGGGVARAAGGSGSSYVGSELDLLITWQIDRHLQAYGGYSHFFAGDFIQDTGPSENIDFVYLALTYTF